MRSDDGASDFPSLMPCEAETEGGAVQRSVGGSRAHVDGHQVGAFRFQTLAFRTLMFLQRRGALIVNVLSLCGGRC